VYLNVFLLPFLVLYQLLIPWNLEAIDIFSKQFIVEGQWMRKEREEVVWARAQSSQISPVLG
jgi:hypothetical protein